MTTFKGVLMNIHMSLNQYNKLINLCKKSKTEQSGFMTVTEIDNDFNINKIELVSEDLIKKRTNKEIVYRKEYLVQVLYELATCESPVYIMFHTHPKGSSNLSEEDIELLKYVQRLSQRLTPNDYVKVIEGIVNDREISFYYYNSENDKLIRVPLFVDNIEKLPLREQSMTKIIKNSFLEGMARAKRR